MGKRQEERLKNQLHILGGLWVLYDSGKPLRGGKGCLPPIYAPFEDTYQGIYLHNFKYNEGYPLFTYFHQQNC